MRIEQSAVNLSAKSSYLQLKTKEESLRVWVNGQPEEALGSQQGNHKEQGSGNLMGSMQQNPWKDFLKPVTYAKPEAVGTEPDTEEIPISEEDKRKIELIEQMFMLMTGKRIKLRVPTGIKLKELKAMEATRSGAQQTNQNQQAQMPEGFGLHYKRTETEMEQSQMDMKGSGSVVTSDGRAIDFNIQVHFSETYVRESSVEIKMGEALKDPLVLHLTNEAPDFTGKTVRLDVDGNGTLDELPFFKGTGYLVYDQNGDGKVNDGSELFGPATDNGYGELAQYDMDGNGWIDEGDQIFDKLKIWTVDAEGNSQLQALLTKDIGAIYLGHVAADYRLYDQQHALQGQMAEAGIYLKESGSVGMMSHLDVKL